MVVSVALKPLAVGRAFSEAAVVRYGSCGRVSNCKLNSKPPACGFNCGLADWQTNRSHWRCRQTHRQLPIYPIPSASVTFLNRCSSLYYVTRIKLKVVVLSFYLIIYGRLEKAVGYCRSAAVFSFMTTHSGIQVSVTAVCVIMQCICVCLAVCECGCVYVWFRTSSLLPSQWFL